MASHHTHHGPHAAHHAHDHPHDHGHEHGHDGHHHDHRDTPSRALALALIVTFAFAGVEAIAGWLAGSLALMSDAGHMVTDSLSLGVALLAAMVAQRPPSARLSYGYARIEVLAALFNAGFMVAVILLIVWNAVERLRVPQAVDGGTVVWIGLIGLCINLLVAWILSRGGDHAHNLNTRGALLHVMGDALGSVAALAAGLVIRYTGWTPIDPLLSMGICALILASTWRLAREAIHTLMEGVPAGLSIEQVGRHMAGVAGVGNVHDLHIWSIDSRRHALSAHVRVRDMAEWPAVLQRLRDELHEDFGIDHVTLQPETPSVATIKLSEVRVRASAGRSTPAG